MLIIPLRDTMHPAKGKLDGGVNAGFLKKHFLIYTKEKFTYYH